MSKIIQESFFFFNKTFHNEKEKTNLCDLTASLKLVFVRFNQQANVRLTY